MNKIISVLAKGNLLRYVGTIYRFMWLNTSGEPWTYIMRRNPVLLLVPGSIITGLEYGGLYYYGAPWQFYPLVLVVNFIHFLAGHVFWGRKVTSLQEASKLYAYWRDQEEK